MGRESEHWEDRLVDSDDESLAIICSSPCLSATVIASGCWEIIAFLSVFSNSSFSLPHFLLSLMFCLLCSLFFRRHPMISHCFIVFLFRSTGFLVSVELCQAFLYSLSLPLLLAFWRRTQTVLEFEYVFYNWTCIVIVYVLINLYISYRIGFLSPGMGSGYS